MKLQLFVCLQGLAQRQYSPTFSQSPPPSYPMKAAQILQLHSNVLSSIFDNAETGTESANTAAAADAEHADADADAKAVGHGAHGASSRLGAGTRPLGPACAFLPPA